MLMGRLISEAEFHVIQLKLTFLINNSHTIAMIPNIIYLMSLLS